MPRAGRRTAVVNLENGHPGSSNNSGMIAIGYPAAQAASLPMHHFQDGGGQQDVALRYVGSTQPQQIYQQQQQPQLQHHDPYRRLAARPAPLASAGPNGALPPSMQQHPPHHIQMQPGGYGTPISTGPTMSTAQYNAYLAASNSIPGGHPAPRTLQMQQQQIAAGPPGSATVIQHRGPFLPAHHTPSIASPPAMSAGSVNVGPGARMPPQPGAPVPASVLIDIHGNAVQPVFRVASQPQPIARPQVNGGPPSARPELPGHRSFSQNQVHQLPLQAQPLSLNPQPPTPQQQHAMYQQQQQHHMQNHQQQQMLQHRASLPPQTPATVFSSVEQQQQDPKLPVAPDSQAGSSSLPPVPQHQEHDGHAIRSSRDAASGPSQARAQTLPARQPSVIALDQPFFEPQRRFSTSPMPMIPEQEQQTEQVQQPAFPAPPTHSPTISAEEVEEVAALQTLPPMQQLQCPQQLEAVPEDALLALLPPASILQPSPLGIATLRLLQLGQALTAALAQPGLQSLKAWVEQFYSEEAHVRFDLAEVDHGQNVYHIPIAALARFYDVLRESGAISFQLLLESPREYTILSALGAPPSGHLVECDQMTWIVGYSSGCQVFSKGNMRARFTRAPVPVAAGPTRSSIVQIDFMEYVFEQHTEFINRAVIKQKSSQAAPADSPKASRAAQAFDAGSPMKQDDTSYEALSVKRKRTEPDEEAAASLPKKKVTCDVQRRDFADSGEKRWEDCIVPMPAVGPAGVSDRAMRILEIAECIDLLGEVISFSRLHNFGPLDALERYATFCVDTGAASRDATFSPTTIPKLPSPFPGFNAMEGQPLAPYSSGESDFSPPNPQNQQSYAAPAFPPHDTTAPPSAPLPSVPRLAPFSDSQANGAVTARSVPSSPVDFEPALLARSNTLPGCSM